MAIYLYLTKPEWINAWELGGDVPISLASRYLSNIRSGTLTPDETQINDFGVEPRTFREAVGIPEGMEIHNSIFAGFIHPAALFQGSLYTQDGLILSFSTEKSWLICKKLGKVACVEIVEIEELKRVADAQIGCEGTMARCEYTADKYRRSHFLKSRADSWQSELRIFWPSLVEQSITIPAGIAKRVSLR